MRPPEAVFPVPMVTQIAPLFPSVDAPAYVRYPIGTHHAAMQQPASVRTDILCWWGLMQATSSTEAGQHVPPEQDGEDAHDAGRVLEGDVDEARLHQEAHDVLP